MNPSLVQKLLNRPEITISIENHCTMVITIGAVRAVFRSLDTLKALAENLEPVVTQNSQTRTVDANVALTDPGSCASTRLVTQLNNGEIEIRVELNEPNLSHVSAYTLTHDESLTFVHGLNSILAFVHVLQVPSF